MSRLPPSLSFMVGAYALGILVIVAGAVGWAVLEQTGDPVMRMLAELARGLSHVVAFGLLGGAVLTSLLSLADVARGRKRIVREPAPRVGRFVDLVVLWGLGFAGAAAIFAPGVEAALAARGAITTSGPGTESALAAVLGAFGVAVATVKWYLESTIWLRSTGMEVPG